ncbi:MAG: TldD/PmbA family protein [Rhodobacterales bacterium]|nr:TldD/PmbA family protein [Rhodobacterales bacterium]
MHQALAKRFRDALPTGPNHISMRLVERRDEALMVRNDVVQPPGTSENIGIIITVHEGGGQGYAATPDLSASGIATAISRARQWAKITAGISVIDTGTLAMDTPKGEWRSPVQTPWSEVPISERIDRLRQACAAAAIDERIINREASVMANDTRTLLLTSDGGEVYQHTQSVGPELSVVVHANGDTQRRSFGGGRGAVRQGGIEVLDQLGFDACPLRVAQEAIALLEAPNCPTGKMDLVLAPDQMMLQIHESIGHPIELDRILGDERNYAGTSFVTLDMFGHYQYGSELLNVSFAPDVTGQLASYGWDDDGTQAERVLLIEKGLLMRPLGGSISQKRGNIAGVANSRGCSWNRPTMDRMANLNVEAGNTPLDELLAGIEHGVFMQTNTSWSIDDSRNKFQFGCEIGREIVDGKLGKILKNPNYRGISANFWRNLATVGDPSTVGIFGTPFCGKGEPNQVISVGHASPVCHFSNIDVFGGAA